MKTLTRWQKEAIKESFYIDRSGNVHRATQEMAENWISMHTAIASKLYPEMDHPEDYLYNQGWIAVGSVAYGNMIKGRPTRAQIKRMRKLGFWGIVDSFGEEYLF